ncbi:MAG: hypothetical protein LBM02_10375, partial [Lachnospiraceae bacterium]|nr:hypothetical protein [Lachnospiraceae bacterium]
MNRIKRVSIFFFFLFVYCVPMSFSMTDAACLKMKNYLAMKEKEKQLKFTCVPGDEECFDRQYREQIFGTPTEIKQYVDEFHRKVEES